MRDSHNNTADRRGRQMVRVVTSGIDGGRLTILEGVEWLSGMAEGVCRQLWSRKKNDRTYPSEIEGQHEHKMGGEYD